MNLTYRAKGMKVGGPSMPKRAYAAVSFRLRERDGVGVWVFLTTCFTASASRRIDRNMVGTDVETDVDRWQ
jgi:hypothetical protein